ncbi:uncharacterized protein [Porites lutea]|uniref:uncharacterized protein n=1 Tax=Porites lutea TaxID=51062 RepID=UPI003CC69AA7
MGSITQFALGAAAGVALFMGANSARRYFLGSPTTNQRDRERINSRNEVNLRQEHIHSIQSAASPIRHVSESSETDLAVVGEENDSKDGQHLLNLLFNIAEDQARKEGYIHRGITCNSCQASPICGIRYKCSNCVDYDLCERCEVSDDHNRTHLFIKIRVPMPPLTNPRAPCLKPLYPGIKDHPYSLSWNEIQHLRKQSHFDQAEIEALVEQFKTLATEKAGITREVFDKCLGPLGQHKNLVMDQMFKFYDQNGDGLIDIDEFVIGLSILVKGSEKEKIPYAFAGCDIENKGYISKENLRSMFKAYFEISLELVRDVVRSCEEEMMASFDDSADKPVSSVFNAPIPSDSGPSTSTGKPAMVLNNPGNTSAQGIDRRWPIMEAMSQDAIDEMVNNVFQCADTDKDGKISFEEFEAWAANDNTILAWFEALGTIF